MFLVIYGIENKRYFGFAKKLSDKMIMTNENFETVVLGPKQKIKSFKFNDFNDFKRVRPELLKYGFRMYIVKTNDVKDKKVRIKFFAELMRNPFYNLIIEEKELENVPEDKEPKIVELKSRKDWELAEAELGFKSDFVNNIF